MIIYTLNNDLEAFILKWKKVSFAYKTRTQYILDIIYIYILIDINSY